MRFLLLCGVMISLGGCGTAGRVVGTVVSLPARVINSSAMNVAPPVHHDVIQTAWIPALEHAAETESAPHRSVVFTACHAPCKQI